MSFLQPSPPRFDLEESFEFSVEVTQAGRDRHPVVA
jgi:hypothetical protein